MQHDSGLGITESHTAAKDHIVLQKKGQSIVVWGSNIFIYYSKSSLIHFFKIQAPLLSGQVDEGKTNCTYAIFV